LIDEERLLGGLAQRVDVVGDHQRRVGARSGGEQMAAAAAGRAPEIDDRLLQPALRERADAFESLGVCPGDVVVKARLRGRGKGKRELPH